jgi:hypothetical protein
MVKTSTVSEAKVLDAIKVLREAMDTIEQLIASKNGHEKGTRRAMASSAVQSWRKATDAWIDLAENPGVTDAHQIPVAEPGSGDGGSGNANATAAATASGAADDDWPEPDELPPPTDLSDIKVVESTVQASTAGDPLPTSTPALNDGASNGTGKMDQDVPQPAVAASKGKTPAEANLAGDDFWARANIRW